MIIKYTSREFFKIYLCAFESVFPHMSRSIPNVLAFKEGKTNFYCNVYKGELIGFFSLRVVSDNLFELGDVGKVSFKFRRSQFAEFLSQVCDEIYNCGGMVVGFPNDLALPMELQAGFQIVKRYQKRISVEAFGFSIRLPVKKLKSRVALSFPSFSYDSQRRYRTTTRALLIASESSGSRWKVGFSVNYQETTDANGFAYISYAGVPVDLIEFSQSDNSI